MGKQENVQTQDKAKNADLHRNLGNSTFTNTHTHKKSNSEIQIKNKSLSVKCVSAIMDWYVDILKKLPLSKQKLM